MVIKITVTPTGFEYELRSGKHFLSAQENSDRSGYYGTCGVSDKMQKVQAEVSKHVKEIYKLIKCKPKKRRETGYTGSQG